MAGRRTALLPSDESVCPRKPGPPLGNWVVVSTTVIAPASMSVMSARNKPLRRSAGSPTSVPSTAVIAPDASSTTGYGSDVAYVRRAAIHAPIARIAICPSDTRPTRPISSPRPSATTE